MPSRFSQYDTDEERLPEGMQRIGYDADTQTYTFRDADGSTWEGPPGARYGSLTKISEPPKPSNFENLDIEYESADGPPPYDDSDAHQPFLSEGTNRIYVDDKPRNWRAELMPLLNFLLIVALFLMGVFWFLGFLAKGHSMEPACAEGGHRHRISMGETCWAIAEKHKIGLDALRDANEGVNCDMLRVGSTICVPSMPMPMPM